MPIFEFGRLLQPEVFWLMFFLAIFGYVMSGLIHKTSLDSSIITGCPKCHSRRWKTVFKLFYLYDAFRKDRYCRFVVCRDCDYKEINTFQNISLKIMRESLANRQ